MKRILITILLAAGFLIFSSSQSYATILFEDDFEGGLSAWTGKKGDVGAHSGVIVPNPVLDSLNSSNSVLSFTKTVIGGDIFTDSSFDSQIDEFRLSFDYLGLGSGDDLGGFVGYSYGYPGTHKWLGGTSTFSGIPDILPDTSEWEHVVISFSASDSIHLMLQDFLYSGDIAGDAYFDNILLENPHPTPEPATVFLVGFGLLAVAGFGRKRHSKKT